MSREKIAFETYTLVLKHSILDGEEEHELEEPIVVKHMTQLSIGNSTYMINEMMEKMKHELLIRCAR